MAGLLFSILVIADFPISGIYIAIAVGKHGALAITWLCVAGTLWWYFLCYAEERFSAALKTRRRKRESLYSTQEQASQDFGKPK
jgi:hypothetical protein